MNQERLLERFLRYVRINTTAREGVEDYPSSQGQWELGRLLVAELQTMGIRDARQNEHAIVLATVPATVDRQVPAIAFCAHLDTSPETSGAGVKPQIIDDYRGGDIPLPGDPDRLIRVRENPELNDLIGRTIITSDGTTLLGADDKAGVAAIMEAAHWFMEHPDAPHGPIRLCFTCDEEIGRGVDFLEPEQLDAVVCYTLDGQGGGTIDVETFSADKAVITVGGVNIHPSIAKGRMVNAVRVASHFLDRLPRDRLSPESTQDREGFLHPYVIRGGVDKVEIQVLLRDFETAELDRQAELLRQVASTTESEFAGAKIEVSVSRQYRNMAEGLAKEPRAVAYAQQALQRLGRTVRLTIVRGGTDGSRLTEKGLPTPNLATGEHAPHSPQEWACLQEMLDAARWIELLAEVWSDPSA